MATVYWLGGGSPSAGSASQANNWSGGSVPTASDVVVFDGALSSQAVDAGLSGSGTLSGVALTSVHILDTFTAAIGTTSSPLCLRATNVYLHEPTGKNGTGSGRIHLNFESYQANVVVYGSKSASTDTGKDPIRIKGTHTSNALTVMGNAKVGVAVNAPGEVATFATVNTAASALGTACQVVLGPGCTLTTIEVGSGTVINKGASATTVVLGGGEYQVYGAATLTTANVRGGTLVYRSTGTLTTLTVGTGAIADFAQDPQAKTVTNCTLERGATLRLANGNPFSITLTNGIDLDNCTLEDVTITTEPHLSVALSTI